MGWKQCIAKVVPALTVALYSSAVHATEPVEAWFEAGLRFKPVKTWRVDASTHLRLDEDLSRVGKVMPEIGSSYRIVGPLRLGAGYRFIWERDKRGDFEPGHRIHADASLTIPLKPFQLRYRLRGQRSWEWTRWGERKDEQLLRNQLRVSYRGTRRVRPAVWAEHFLDLDNLDEQPTSKWRVGLGAEVQTGDVELEPFVMMEIASREQERLETYILGVSLTWEPFAR